MTRRVLTVILRLSPEPFRDRCGEEFFDAYEWRMTRQRYPSSRVALAVREVLGLSTVVLRMRLREALRAASARIRTAGMRLEPEPARWSGPAMAASPLVILVANGFGYGSGIEAAFAAVPLALVVFAWGLIARARSTDALSQWLKGAVWLTAAFACALAVLVVLTGVTGGGVHAWVSMLRYPAAVGLFAGITSVGLLGIALREIPLVPAAAVSLTAVMIALGLMGAEEVSLAGLALSILAWIALAITPWGPRATRSTR
jgi:hypothetical protein